MNTQQLIETANGLMAEGKGLLAMDESMSTISQRFEKEGIANTEENRRAYRELIVTTPGIGECLSGAILFDETVHQSTKDGVPFITVLERAGVIPGIKVDEGTTDLAGFPGEKITLGLDHLRQRLAVYHDMRLRFAKWRAVITIGPDIPTMGCIHANMHALARYAALCQEAGLVPIVEPEVLMDGRHDIELCFAVTKNVLTQLFIELNDQRVDLRGLILKPNMVLPGKESVRQVSVEAVAKATVTCLLSTVPETVPGIAFLSGGQSPEAATGHLNAMHSLYGDLLPWALTFSFSRAIQDPELHYWKGKEENTKEAQHILYERMLLNTLARKGEYKPVLESLV
ncbi:MAG TPA: class I fructose-bisphosphate aldolase [Puia sp.]|jgi:fructose-bisphosphate aldolase class I|nr:class I fructose-bisphosphate aldolase [Puia sp.]